MSNSTPEQKIAVLNGAKDTKTAQINSLNASIENYDTLIDNYTKAIREFETKIVGAQGGITELESDNAILDEVIVDETPPLSELSK